MSKNNDLEEENCFDRLVKQADEKHKINQEKMNTVGQEKDLIDPVTGREFFKPKIN
jgi:hypothetical protein